MKRILGVVGVLLVLVCPLIAQLSTSSILGTVRDASGAVIPGAKITVTNTGTNVTRTTESGNDGLYRIDGLQPGDYNVTIEKAGFSTERLNALTLTVAQNAEANVALKVGSQQETVQVEADTAPQINVTSSALGGLVNDKQVAELPLNGRNFIDLALMQPGVANAQNNSMNLLKANLFSTNGAPVRSNLTSLDGAPMVNVLGSTSSAVGTTLGLDGIQEFRVISNIPPAQYGMGMGSQIVISSKGGSNQFHGDAFDYLRNDVMDAWGYFATASPKLIKNNFGGAFGGPIRKDKTFFFADYEGIKQIQGLTNSANTFNDGNFPDPTPQSSTNPTGLTAAQWQTLWTGYGDSSLSCNYYGQGGAAVLTHNPCAYVQSTNPTGAVNQVMVPFIELYPEPNITPTSTAPTYAANNNQPESVNYGQIRVDQTFSASDSMFGRFTIDKSDLPQPVSFKGTPYQKVGVESIGSDQFDSVVENHVFSPTLLNTGRISYSRTLNQNVPTNPAAFAAAPYQMVYNQNVWAGSIAVTSGLAGLGPQGTAPQGFNQNVYTVSDDLNWTKGKHAVQFGTIFNRVEYYLYDAQSIRGGFTFTNAASLLAGNYQVFAVQPPGSNYYREPRYYTFGFYAQDDWRYTSRLTFNLGLRYEPDTAPLDRQFSRDWAFHTQVDTAPTQGAILRNTSLKNFQPRIGFAWDVNGDGKTAVRGGFGVYDDVNSMGQSFYGPSAATPPTSIVINLPNGTVSKLPIVDATYALAPNTMPYGQALKTTIWSIQQPRMMQYNVSVQRQLTGSMSITLAYAGSKGQNLWDNEEGNPCQPNSVNNGVPSWSNPYLVAPAGVNGGNPAGSLPDPRPGATGFVSVICNEVVGAGQPGAHLIYGTYPNNASYPGYYVVASRINPLWGDWLLATTNGFSNYNAGEFSLNKRVSHGLEATVAYTYSKVMDTTQGQYSISECQGSGGIPSTDLQPARRIFDYGPACFDVPQQLQASALYHLPNVNKAGVVGKELLSGWWMGNKTTWQTGFSFSPTMNNWRSLDQNVTSNNGYQSEFVNYGTQTVVPGAVGADGTVNSTGSTFIPYNKNTVIVNSKATKGYVQWFNPLMFTDTPLGQLGTVHKGAMRGPHFSTVDLSLNKDTALPGMGEKGALEFRAEIFNLFNRSNFAVPSGYKSFNGATATSNVGMYTESPISTAGRTTAIVGNPRQIQLSLKLLF